MDSIDVAQQVLHGQIPSRIDVGGLKHPGATAYYQNVPTTALPSQCILTRTSYGFAIKGKIDDCGYSGQVIKGDQDDRFPRVMLSFVRIDTPVSQH